MDVVLDVDISIFDRVGEKKSSTSIPSKKEIGVVLTPDSAPFSAMVLDLEGVQEEPLLGWRKI